MAKCCRADGTPYGPADEVLVKDLTVAEIQSMFICDKLLTGRPRQTNDPDWQTLLVACDNNFPSASAGTAAAADPTTTRS